MEVASKSEIKREEGRVERGGV